MKLAAFKKEPLVNLFLDGRCAIQKAYQANLVGLFLRKDLIL